LKNNTWKLVAQLGKQTNTEHGEENVQMKAHAYVGEGGHSRLFLFVQKVENVEL